MSGNRSHAEINHAATDRAGARALHTGIFEMDAGHKHLNGHQSGTRVVQLSFSTEVSLRSGDLCEHISRNPCFEF